MTACEACREKRVHTAAEWTAHHEYARHGYSEAGGWTHPALMHAAERAKERAGAASPAQSAATPANGDVLTPCVRNTPA